MNKDNREIRVFISSTFSDMREERIYLNTKVFPELRTICEKRGVIFTEVDLQWGISEKEASQGGAVEVCLEEINRCQPYFIGLLGERYGWSPQDDGLIVREYKEKYSDEDEKKIIPISNDDLKKDIRKWVQKGESVTAMEIMHGVLDSCEQATYSYFYFRDEDYTKSLLAKAQTEMKENAVGLIKEAAFIEPKGSDKKKKLAKLKKRILDREKKWKVRKEFNGEGETKHKAGYVDVEQLGNQIRTDLLKVINERFPEGEGFTTIEKERNFHIAFANSRLQSYISDERIFTRMFDHLRSKDSPLVISGKMGSGKSALLANFTVQWSEKNSNGFVIQHYAGSGGESNVIGVLRRIMGEIKHEYDGVEEEIPTQADDIYQKFGPWLLNATAKKPLLLLLDGVNQFNGELKRLVNAFPESLGQHVQVILSTLEGEVLDSAVIRGWHVEKVIPLSIPMRGKLVESYLQRYSKKLSSELTETLINCDTGENPLFLMVVLDELRIDANHDVLKKMLDQYLEAEDLVKLFEMVLVRCSGAYTYINPKTGKKVRYVPHVMRLIYTARYGLSYHELRVICNENSKLPVPPAYLSQLIFGLGRYLADREGLYGFMHDALRQAVEKHFINSESERDARQQVTDYFSKEEVSHRQIDELPWHYKRLDEKNKLSTYLSHGNVFKYFCVRYDWIFELHNYWSYCEMDTFSFKELLNSLLIEGFDLSNPWAPTQGDRNCFYLNKLGCFAHSVGKHLASLEIFTQSIKSLDANNEELIDARLGFVEASCNNFRYGSVMVTQGAVLSGRIENYDCIELCEKVLEDLDRIDKGKDSLVKVKALCLLANVMITFQGLWREAEDALELSNHIIKCVSPHHSNSTYHTWLKALAQFVYENGSVGRIHVDLPFDELYKIILWKFGETYRPEVAYALSVKGDGHFLRREYADASSCYNKSANVFARVKNKEQVLSVMEKVWISDLAQGNVNDVRNSLAALAAIDIKSLFSKALSKFALIGDIDACKLMIQQEVNVRNNKTNYPPLVSASINAHEQVCSLLLESGAELDYYFIELEINGIPIPAAGYTPLITAAYHRHFNLCHFFLERGAQVDKQINAGCTALIIASQVGDLKICRLLLKKGADVNLVSVYGRSPLMVAAQNGHMNICQLLLEAGARVDLQENDEGYIGRRALDWAEIKGNKDISELLKSL